MLPQVGSSAKLNPRLTASWSMVKDSSLGIRIREAREARHMSRSDFARLIGVTSTAVWNWEVHRAKPRAPMLDVISKVLGVAEPYLSTGSGITQTEQRSASEIIHHAQFEIAQINGVPP